MSERFPVRSAKIEELQASLRRLGVKLSLIEETFTRGGGKGGQKINKTSSAVRLSYPPLKIAVRCQRERSRSLNRYLALRELAEKIEEKLFPGSSKKAKEIKALRRRKSRRRSRVRKKYLPQK